MEQATSQIRQLVDRTALQPDAPSLRQTLQDLVAAADWDGALASWARVEDADAADGNSYVWAAIALRRLSRLEDADALIEAGRAACPGHAQLMIDHAWVAVERHGWAAAHPRWQAAWAALPDRAPVAAALGRCLREMADFAAAETHLAAAVSRFSDDMAVAVEWADVAQYRRDWPETVARWRRLVRQFPQAPQLLARLAGALREAGRPDEAEATCAEALARGLFAPSVLQEHAINAHVRGDWPQAWQRWTVLRAEAPDLITGYTWGATALQNVGRGAAAEALLQQAAQRFPDRSDILIAGSHLVQDRGDWSAALRCWGEVKEKHPNLPNGYLGASQALRQLGRVGEAEAVLAPALRLFPAAFDVLTEHAWNGNRGGDLDEALRRWEAVRDGFPDRAIGYVGAAVAFRQAGRVGAAEALLDAAVTRFPSDYPAASDHAAIAVQRGDFAAAVARWRGVVERFPRRAAAHVGLAAAIRDGGDLDTAEAVAEAALGTLGEDCELRILLAGLALKRGDAAESERRWARLRADEPALSRVFAGSISALRELGRLDAAEQLATEALQRFPDDLELERQRALTLSARRDWPAALPLWEKLKRRAPADPAILSSLRDVLWRAQIDQGAGLAGSGDDALAPFEIPAFLLAAGGADEDGHEQLRQLLMRFESLGHTCEFGIVQRRFGAEPLGLLRWASIAPDNLLKALQARFAGMGEPEQTTLRVSLGEYVTTDSRYHIFSHTFTKESQAPRDRFYAQLSKRTMFLRRVLIETIEAGQKILVYRYGPDFSSEQLLALHDAVKAYNPATLLLGVRLEDAQHPSGTVEVLCDGLLAGYIDRFSTVDISVEAWLTLCRQAAAVQDAAAARLASPSAAS